MKATPKQRIYLTLGSFAASQVLMAMSHEGFLGTIIAAGVGYAGWSFADEILSKVQKEEGDNASPSNHQTGLLRRVLVPRSQRMAEWMPSEEDVEDIAERIKAGEQRGGAFTLNTEDEDGGTPTFKQLLEMKAIQKMILEDYHKPLLSKRVIVGYAEGKRRYVTMKDLYSCGIGGTSGTGKSTTVRFLLFQFILLGFKLVMIDPHIKDVEESLAAQFASFQGVHALPPCSDQDEQVRKRVDALQKELDRRTDAGDKSGPPLLFVLDEFNILMRSARVTDGTRQALAKLLKDIEQGGRKFSVFAWIIGQKWANYDLGGNDGVTIRTSLVSRIAHRFSDEDQGATFLGVKNAKMKDLITQVPTGHYLFMDADGGRSEIITPQTLASDGDMVLQLMGKSENVASRPTQSQEDNHEDDEEDVQTLRRLSYAEYLQTQHWQSKRKEALQHAVYRCQICNAGGVQLDVHHRTYQRLGAELLSDLFVLCHECHDLFSTSGKLAKYTPTQDKCEDAEDLPETDIKPIIPDKSPKADDLSIEMLCAIWNGGGNSILKLMKLCGFNNYEAQKARKRIIEHAGKHIEEAID
jgi:Helicase HerA, central domain